MTIEKFEAVGRVGRQAPQVSGTELPPRAFPPARPAHYSLCGPGTVELIFSLGALSPRGGPVPPEVQAGPSGRSTSLESQHGGTRRCTAAMVRSKELLVQMLTERVWGFRNFRDTIFVNSLATRSRAYLRISSRIRSPFSVALIFITIRRIWLSVSANQGPQKGDLVPKEFCHVDLEPESSTEI